MYRAGSQPRANCMPRVLPHTLRMQCLNRRCYRCAHIARVLSRVRFAARAPVPHAAPDCAEAVALVATRRRPRPLLALPLAPANLRENRPPDQTFPIIGRETTAFRGRSTRIPE